ncbi:MAG: hypothetical protein RR382_00640 [Tannerellaceae bacterium]
MITDVEADEFHRVASKMQAALIPVKLPVVNEENTNMDEVMRVVSTTGTASWANGKCLSVVLFYKAYEKAIRLAMDNSTRPFIVGTYTNGVVDTWCLMFTPYQANVILKHGVCDLPSAFAALKVQRLSMKDISESVDGASKAIDDAVNVIGNDAPTDASEWDVVPSKV